MAIYTSQATTSQGSTQSKRIRKLTLVSSPRGNNNQPTDSSHMMNPLLEKAKSKPKGLRGQLKKSGNCR
jgi:hypothetical protein